MTEQPGRREDPDRVVRTIFFGSGAFATPTLRALASMASIRLVAVVAPADRPAGRGGKATAVPVVAAARTLGLNLLQPDRLRVPETTAALGDLRPELIVLADFGRIIPPSILELPTHGSLNVHPSLLPRHRGAAPIPATILSGDEVAGVSIMQMDAGLDTGPIVAARSWPLLGTETAPELEAAAAAAGADLLREIVEPYVHGKLEAVPQHEADATLTRPLRRADGRLDPMLRAVDLERQVRAFQPWPGSYVETRAGRLVVRAAQVRPSASADSPGDIVADGTGLALAASDGRLALVDVQAAGGQPMPAAAFRRGHPGVLGRIVEPGP